MSDIRDYRDLIAWQRAIALAVLVDRIVERLPQRSWKLAAQMRDASRSVHANIAEGNGRLSIPDYLRHLGMSNASLNELESDLFFWKEGIRMKTSPKRSSWPSIPVVRFRD